LTVLVVKKAEPDKGGIGMKCVRIHVLGLSRPTLDSGMLHIIPPWHQPSIVRSLPD
jgi:hypothetical protein